MRLVVATMSMLGVMTIPLTSPRSRAASWTASSTPTSGARGPACSSAVSVAGGILVGNLVGQVLGFREAGQRAHGDQDRNLAANGVQQPLQAGQLVDGPGDEEGGPGRDLAERAARFPVGSPAAGINPGPDLEIGLGPGRRTA